MIDSHCHLDREPLISNLSQVLTRAKDVGLEKLLTICTSISGYKNNGFQYIKSLIMLNINEIFLCTYIPNLFIA